MNDPVEKHMIPFEKANPLPASSSLNEVVMRFFKEPAVPVIDDWGSCIGIVHRCDCIKVPFPPNRGPLCI